MRKRIVFVFGMHRSGTSLTTELINSLGFSVPGTSLDQMDEVNAHGFWESKEVVDVNERILASAQLKWYHICPVGHVFHNLKNVDSYKVEVAEFIRRESDKHGDLVIKDPRLCILWPLWFSAIDCANFDIKVVFVNRHPSSIAASIKKRDGFSFFSSRLLCLYYVFSVFSAKSFPPLLALDYDAVLSSSDRLKALSDFLGANSISESDWNKSVDPELCRNHPESDPVEMDSAIYSLDTDVYRLFSHGAIYQDFEFLAEKAQVFEKFIFESDELIYALNESNNSIVDSRTELIKMGALHSDALRVIGDKDYALFENAAYIDNCHSRIADLDLLVSRLGVLPDKVADLEARLSFCQQERAQSSDYIAECEGRIFNLEFSLSGFSALRSQFDKLNGVLINKDMDHAKNVAYISDLQNRISDLEVALVEFEALRARICEIEQELATKEADAENNRSYIDKCHKRIGELEDLFAQQRKNYLSALDSISQLEGRLALRNDEFLSVIDELTGLRKRFDILLQWKIVRIINNRIPENGVEND